MPPPWPARAARTPGGTACAGSSSWQPHQLRVRHVQLVERVEAARVGPREGAADGSAVADHQRWELARGDLVEGGGHTPHVLGQRLASGEAEVLAGAPPRGPQLGVVVANVVDEPPLPV